MLPIIAVEEGPVIQNQNYRVEIYALGMMNQSNGKIGRISFAK